MGGLAPCLATGEFGHSLHDIYADFCKRMSLADFLVIAAEAVMTLLAPDATVKKWSEGFKNNFMFGRKTLTGGKCKKATHNPDNLLLPNPAKGCPETKRVFIENMGLTWAE